MRLETALGAHDHSTRVLPDESSNLQLDETNRIVAGDLDLVKALALTVKMVPT
jgi:hypothetical protein